jgi:ribosomal protein S18 acetylase RimI-like enzyme
VVDISPPAGFTAHIGGPIDPDELFGLVSAESIAAIGRVEWSADIVIAMVSLPTIDPERDRLWIRGTDGRLVGVTVVDHSPPYVSAHIRGFVHPDHLDSGIGTEMLSWALQRAEERVELAPAGARVTATAGAAENYEPATALLEANGFGVERYFLEMATVFSGRPDQPVLLDGIRLRGFEGAADLGVLSRVVSDSFRDHFGYVSRSPEEELAKWAKFHSIETWDDSLVWIAQEGDEPIGSIVALGQTGEDTTTGYIATIGVRPPWRGRGVARAMMLGAFNALYDRGKSGAALHVDADSPTGATRLYDGVGMNTVSRTATYLRELRSGLDHVVR